MSLFFLSQTRKKIIDYFNTLIGNDGHTFFISEMSCHIGNKVNLDENYFKKYDTIKHKFLLIVIPNKSIINKVYLPDGYNLQYRPSYNLAKEYFGNNIIDGYEFLINYDNVYYKTDTHINLLGNYLIYTNFVDKINTLFNLKINKKNINIQSRESVLTNENDLLGDLLKPEHLGEQTVSEENKIDVFYYSDDFEDIMYKHIIKKDDSIRLLNYDNNKITDETDLHINELIVWDTISKYILYSKNNLKKKHKILIFYDSMITHVLHIYLTMFDEVFCSKSKFNIDLVNFINPDYIFEFRVERFISN